MTVAAALTLFPVMLLRRRGDTLHRALGWIWVVLLMTTALVSFDIRLLRHGALSPIHIISAFVLVQTPLVVLFARRHDVIGHRISVRSTVAGALLMSGFFTFPFGRMLGTWLAGG